MPGGLLTDLYELNMAASYLRRGMSADATALAEWKITCPKTNHFFSFAQL